MQLLDIRNLTVEMKTPHGMVRVLDKVNLQLGKGEIHSLVGESGSGKSLLAKAIVGFANPNWEVTADRLWWNGQDLLAMNTKQRRAVTGRDMAMIFQDPYSYLDPNSTIEQQIVEAIPEGDVRGTFMRRRVDRKTRVKRLLHRVGIRDHESVIDSYPFELSQGVAQKVSIAIAIAHRPRLLIADEPTTAMEPSTKLQIHRLLARLAASQEMSVLLISQDLTSILPETKQLTLLYCGQLMETGPAEEVINHPAHPYTDSMLRMSLQTQQELPHKARLPTLPGAIPTLRHMPIGCRLGPRCPYAQKQCVKAPLATQKQQRVFHCHFPLLELES
ncbi:peptide ABC transporter ATP-binding protein [Idiomarina sp. WRN-38]|jgi:cationic peptide transport system ATP-binding protein|uniref:oligopeptide/dipeptide ABC transporter ATP-binding protein n=1 Tax=Idiomarina sp. OXR-189 TaxID=3100175 RepID=UPI0007338AAE|nr:oligopeptide/dipeptide ABC transporter ATP-binding protein [Idiomarina sp. OXR-189]KTG23831.1 peptide ABC transporter ATP-binding protein [Idiomarina sp. H105]MCH2454553.1 ATP-binding cassette domain-containing protein [Idiomarina sp.]OAE91222.1 peptide ABC transporter ATP-binding protein [Idiomarina sp. WRN-38]WPZ02454.1 oligopeptide/dipeptide ABC transporter ATP-binding protein [Idiomarina sp. OXR-189]